MGGNALRADAPAEIELTPSETSIGTASGPPVDSAKAPADAAKKPYPPPADLPTQPGPDDIRFDFNRGARIVLPNREGGGWRVRLSDLDTGNILFENENKGAF